MDDNDFYPSVRVKHLQNWSTRDSNFEGVREGDYVKDFVVPTMRKILKQKFDVPMKTITILDEEYKFMNITVDEAGKALQIIIQSWNKNDPNPDVAYYTFQRSVGFLGEWVGYDVTLHIR